MKPEVIFMNRIKLYCAMLSLLLFSLVIWTPIVNATILNQADMETGDMSQWQAYQSPNHADTFANFGIPALPGGGSYCATGHSVTGVDQASLDQLIYNVNGLANGYFRMYMFFPSGFTAQQASSNSLKLIDISNVQVLDQTVMHLYQNSIGTLRLTWYHYPTFLDHDIGVSVSKGIWHLLEVNINAPTGLVQIWFDADSRTQSPTWTNTGKGDTSYVRLTTNAIHINENWSGGLAPQTEDWYMDGVAWADAPIGDTYGLLGAQPPPDTTPPAAPTGLTVQ